VGGRKSPFPITLAIGLYNSLYYRTSRDCVLILRQNVAYASTVTFNRLLIELSIDNATCYFSTQWSANSREMLLCYLHLTSLQIHLSSVCLLSVTFVRPTQRVELFATIFAPSNKWRTRAVCIKILEKIRGVLGDCKLNGWGLLQTGIFQPISRFISKTIQGTLIVTMEDK